MKLVVATMQHETNTFSPLPTPYAAYAEPSGRVLDSAFERIAERIFSAVADGCDAVLLDLHGAMVTESYEDGEGEVQHKLTWGRLPLMAAMLCQTPLSEPMMTPMNLAIDAEQSGKVLNASVFGGFPLADIPHVSLSTVIVSDSDNPDVQRLRDRMCG
jgi:microcystin degradation protein MlrC